MSEQERRMLLRALEVEREGALGQARKALAALKEYVRDVERDLTRGHVSTYVPRNAGSAMSDLAEAAGKLAVAKSAASWAQEEG